MTFLTLCSLNLSQGADNIPHRDVLCLVADQRRLRLIWKLIAFKTHCH